MQRVTITLDDELMAEVDAIIAARGYQNRSEAIRDLARAGISEAAPSDRAQARLRRGAGLCLRPRRASARQAPDRPPITIITRCRSPRCMCISTTTPASR